MAKRRTRSSTRKGAASSPVKSEEPEEQQQQEQQQMEEGEVVEQQVTTNGVAESAVINNNQDPEVKSEPELEAPIVVDSTTSISAPQEDLFNYDDDDDEDDDEEGMSTIDEIKSEPNNQHVQIELKAKIDTDDEFHEVEEKKPVVKTSKPKTVSSSEQKKESGSSPAKSKTATPTKSSTSSSSASKSEPSKSSSSSSKPTSLSASKESTSKSPKTTTTNNSSSSSSASKSTSSKSGESKPKTLSVTTPTSLKLTSSSSKEQSSASKKKEESSSSKKKTDYDDEYWRRMASRSKDSFHDPTDKELFMDNIWKRMKGNELTLCQHKHSTDCMLWLIENQKEYSKLRKITENLAVEKLTLDLLKEDYMSEIIEALVEVLVRLLVEEKDFESSTSKWVIKYLDGFAKLICDNIKQLLTDSSGGCRIVIVTLEAIGGIRVGRHWSRQNMRFGSGVKVNLQSEIEKDMSFKELPSPFKHHLKRYAKTLILDASDSDIKEILFGRATQVAQYMLFVLKVRYPELCQMVVKKLVEIVFGTTQDRDMITQSASSAYIVEIIMMVASETRLSKIWTKYMKGNLEALWKHDIANFIVQRLIDAIRDDNLFADVCKEIFPSLAEIFKYNRAGIGVCLAKACQDFPKMQHELVSALLKAYECYEPKDKQLDLVPSMLFIETKDLGANKFGGNPRFNQGNFPRIQIWLHGSLMLQYMMSYADPYKVCKSLLSLSTEDVIKIAKDRSGSHVIDAFVHGDNVPIKHKSELVERFLGHYHHLSMDKFGSRIVENILSLSDTNVKRAIMEELSQHEDKLTSNRNGWFVAKKVGLHHFKHRPNDWRNADFSRERKKRTFSEFLSGPLGPNRGQGPSGSGGFGFNSKRGRFHG